MTLKKENTPSLETQRLRLRKFTQEDWGDLFLIYSDLEVNTFLPWFPLHTMEEARQFLANQVFPRCEKEIDYFYSIEHKQNGRVIGYVSLGRLDEDKASGDLGYGQLKEYWNQGIVTEAAAAVLKKLKENGFRLITATHDVKNPRRGVTL